MTYKKWDYHSLELHYLMLYNIDPLKYCPWCGTEFPKSLRDEWADEVEKKFSVESILDKEELKKVPEEYMTEEWWKKKGL